MSSVSGYSYRAMCARVAEVRTAQRDAEAVRAYSPVGGETVRVA